MEPIPFVVPRAIRPLAGFRLRAGLGLRLPARSELGSAPLPLAYAGRLYADLAAELGDPGAGLRVGAASRFEDAPLGRDVAGSFTLGAALEAGARASSRYCGGQRLWLTRRGDVVWLQRRFPDALRQGRRQGNDFALLVLIDLVRRAVGPGWRPTELHLEGPAPPHAEELGALAEQSTHFGAWADRLVFPASLLARPLPTGCEHLPTASPQLADADFLVSVRATIRWLLGVGELSLPNVAEAAGWSVRSLQRRLAATGLHFARLVEEARFEAASRLLRDPTLRVIDIAFELGYTDAANFTRAFRRWAGVSPLAFRRASGTGRGIQNCEVPETRAAPGA